MKVAGIWRMVSMMLIGVVLGLVLSYIVLNKVAPSGEGQNITIGKLVIKKSSQVEDVINIDQDSQNDNSARKKLFNKRK